MSDLQTVAVLDLRDGPEAVAGASILATLDQERYRRLGLVFDRNESGALRDGVLDALALLPKPGDMRFPGELSEALIREGARVVLPGSMIAAHALARSAALLERDGVATPFCDPALLEKLAREGVAALGRRSGLPLGRFIDLPQDGVNRAAANLPYPVLFLGADSRRIRATDEWEAIHAWQALAPTGRVDAVPVDPTRLFEVALVTDAEQRLLAVAAVRVLADDARARPWMAVTIDNQAVLEAARRAILALDLVGPFTLLFQWDGPTYRLLDVQPGFPLWIEVVLGGGPHLVERSIAVALGEATPVTPEFTPPGILFSQSSEDLVFDPEDPVLSNLESEV